MLPESNDRIFFLTVDGTDFRIQEPTDFDRTWYSHKFKKAAVKYEVALAMDGNIVWTNGPFRGSKNDMTIFREGLMAHIPEGKLVIADKGYRGEPMVSYPNPQDREDVAIFKARALARHETVNKRFKDFKILGETFRHANGDPLGSHRVYFFAIVVLTQVKIEMGEPLFNLYA